MTRLQIYSVCVLFAQTSIALGLSSHAQSWGITLLLRRTIHVAFSALGMWPASDPYFHLSLRRRELDYDVSFISLSFRRWVSDDSHLPIQMGMPMNLKLLMAVTLIAIAPTVAFAQKDDPADPAPKPTLADVQKVVQTISSDKTKLQAYCELGNLQDQMQKAEDRNDTKAVDELVAGADSLATRVGPEYLSIVEGLEQVDPKSVEGQKYAAVFNSLLDKCK